MPTSSPAPRVRAAYTAALLFAVAVPVVAGRSLAINDDAGVIALLQAGEAHTLILSYALSRAFVVLYAWAPAFPWYSALLFATLAAPAVVVAAAAAQLHVRSRVRGAAMALLGASVLAYAAFFPTVTLGTFTLLVAAALAPVAFPRAGPGVWAASAVGAVLLRFSLGPLLIGLLVLLGMELLVLRRGRAAVAAVALVAAFTGLVWAAEARAYGAPAWREWSRFNLARGIQYDFAGLAPHDPKLIPPADFAVFTGGWPYDKEAVSNAAVIANSGSLAGLYERLWRGGVGARARGVFGAYGWFFVPWLVALVVALVERPSVGRALMLVPSAGAGLALLVTAAVRDTPRVSFGLVMLATCLLVPAALSPGEGSPPRARRFAGAFWMALALTAASAAVRAVPEWWAEQSTAARAVAAYGRELADLTARRPVTVIVPSIALPTRIPPYLYGFRLFHERERLLAYGPFFPAGWFARSPFFEEQLRKTGAKTFHDLVVRPGTVFLGTGPLRGTEGLLGYLDTHFAPAGCAHAAAVVEAADTLNLTAISLACPGVAP